MEEYSFSGQKNDEKVVLIMNQHPWVMIKPALKILAIILVATIVIKITLGYSSVMGPVYIIGAVALLLIILIGGKNYFVWQNSIMVLTDTRLILVDQNGWFNRMVTETNLENILTINHAINGPIRTLLNFGDLNIRASGVVEDEIIFYDVYNPYEIQQAIVKAQSELHQDGSDDNNQKKSVLHPDQSQNSKRPILR
ncbi:MAG: hypothetical protein ACD_58C00038G0007 [uncultured bacterium]|nr:MAG: hypothetical protein ACD_58C00038G0007 [uncultured bacterium]